jgi:hypothetical protein
METEPFVGRSVEMKKESPFLASEDIMDVGDVEVEISGVYRHVDAIFDDGRKDTVYALGFVGKNKHLILNNKNRKTLIKKFGTTKTTEWHGKKIKLYVDTNVRFGKDIVCGIRIR